MLLAIESFVRLFETLLIERPAPKAKTACRADNDNEEAGDEERRWAAYR